MEIDILQEKLASLLKFPQFPEDAITRLENLLDKVNTAEEAAIQATDALSKGRGPAERLTGPMPYSSPSDRDGRLSKGQDRCSINR